MEDTRPDSATENIPDRATFYYPRLAGTPGMDRSRCAKGIRPAGRRRRVPLHTLGSRPVRTRGWQRHGAATGHSRDAPGAQRLNSGEDPGYGLGWTLETLDARRPPSQHGRAWHESRLHRGRHGPHDLPRLWDCRGGGNEHLCSPHTKSIALGIAAGLRRNSRRVQPASDARGSPSFLPSDRAIRTIPSPPPFDYPSVLSMAGAGDCRGCRHGFGDTRGRRDDAST